MKSEVEVYDTTLRDGSQGEGVNFSVVDKLRLAERLDAFGVHFIEGGWPGSNPRDIEFFKQARRRKFRHAQLAAFGSTRRKNTTPARDPQVRLLIEAGTPVVTIYGKTWLVHVKEVLRTSPEENLAMIAETIRYLKRHVQRVIYDAEHAFDGYKDDPDYAVRTWQAAEAAGADRVVLCDTNGGCLPGEVAEITKAAATKVSAPIGIHTHDDIGLGVANALAAIQVGAIQIQGTMNGYGERTGNCNLTTAIPNIALKLKRRCLPEASLRKLVEVSQFVDEIANLRHNPRQPWVGAAAFAHKGGTHVNAVQKLVRAYEHIDPASVGNRRRILISDLAGRSNIVMKAEELGFKVTNETPELKTILARVKELEHQGYEFEAAEGSLALLIRGILRHEEPPFKVEGYHVSIRRDGPVSICQATTKVRVGNQIAHTVAEGDGPVNALDAALRAALVKFYPRLKKMKLTDYKVRILESSTGTAARTRVLLESRDEESEWGTVGASPNIIEASLQALAGSVEYALVKRKSRRHG